MITSVFCKGRYAMRHEYSFLSEYVKVSVTGRSCERFFNLCINHDILLYQIAGGADHFTMLMKASDFLKIRRLVKKCGIHVTVCQKHGFPFFLKKHRKRKFFLLGWIWCCFFLYVMSLHIWKIEIHGNQQISREQLMQYLEDAHMGYGCRKKAIDCKQTAADIRNAFPEITWVAVKKQGTLLEIDLKENTDKSYSVPQAETEMADSQQGSSLVATQDGRIIDIITRSGIACVTSGQKVKKGDLLVSGIVPITNDENEIVSREYVQADADIVLEITGTYTAQIPRERSQTVYAQEENHGYYLRIFQKLFSTAASLTDTSENEILTEEHQLTLFSDFYLPVIWGKIRIRSFTQQPVLLSDSEIESQATQQLDKFITEKKEKGVQILKKNVRIEIGMTFCKCVCTYQAYTSETRRIPSMQMEENEEGTFS